MSAAKPTVAEWWAHGNTLARRRRQQSNSGGRVAVQHRPSGMRTRRAHRVASSSSYSGTSSSSFPSTDSSDSSRCRSPVRLPLTHWWSVGKVFRVTEHSDTTTQSAASCSLPSSEWQFHVHSPESSVRTVSLDFSDLEGLRFSPPTSDSPALPRPPQHISSLAEDNTVLPERHSVSLEKWGVTTVDGTTLRAASDATTQPQPAVAWVSECTTSDPREDEVLSPVPEEGPQLDCRGSATPPTFSDAPQGRPRSAQPAATLPPHAATSVAWMRLPASADKGFLPEKPYFVLARSLQM